MIISEIGIRGFKSFGNNEQVLKLNTEKGELCLLMGKNGNGKSSLINSFEYTVYGKCRGRSKKWSTLSSLPNRINNELLNRIKFKSNGVEVEIKRGINPGILSLSEDGIDNDRAGKVNLDKKIEEYVGVDIDTFKSFISLSINDFKNFISLTNEEKQMLLDKLFNLEVINILNGILKDMNRINKSEIIKYDSEIATLENSIRSITLSIDKSVEKSVEDQKNNIQVEIEDLKKNIEAKKPEYVTLKEKVDKIKEKESILNTDMEKSREQYINVQNEYKNIKKDLDLYDSGKCPTCSTDFNSDHFVSLRQTLVDKLKAVEEVRKTIESNVAMLKDRKLKLSNLSSVANKSFNDIQYLLKDYKQSIERLEKDINKEIKPNINVKEFEDTIKDLEGKKASGVKNVSLSKDKELYYKELNKIFGEDGVKKSIISGIIKPINHFINENISKMHLPYQIIMDETFNADIKQFGVSVEHDTLSTGENRRINIAILVAYLKLIRTKKHINILFLDEVFASVDMEGIESILGLLKDFANSYNINIFVVHHAIMSRDLFDRIIRLDKDVFTTIVEDNEEVVE